MRKRKPNKSIPKEALAPLLETCDWILKLDHRDEKSAAEIFERFVGLMKRYEGYFFSEPWPEDYDFERATTFTDDDVDFLFENTDEFNDRYWTVCLKKNMHMKGFMGYFGIMWTQQAFTKEFLRPHYEETLEKSKALRSEGLDSANVLNRLKEHESIYHIHDSFADLLERSYPDEDTRRVTEEILMMVHEVEGMSDCHDYRCPFSKRQDEQRESASQMDRA